MTGLDKAERTRRFDMCRTLLEAHFAEYQTIPSMAGLARLWGYASKSSAARIVDAMVRTDVLFWSPDRRLGPGSAFRKTCGDEASEDHSIAPLLGVSPDPLHAAAEIWSDDYDAVLGRSYLITARILRLARSMEREMAQSAAKEGLTSGDVLLMDALYRVGPPYRVAPTALKGYFLMTLAGVIKRVGRLEVLGFIERVPNPEDGRGIFIQLTQEGRAALMRLAAADRDAPHILWPSTLSDTQYQALEAALSVAEQMVSGHMDKK